MIARLGEWATKWAQRLMPDPFLFVVLLTFVTIALAWVVTGVAPLGTRKAARVASLAGAATVAPPLPPGAVAAEHARPLKVGDLVGTGDTVWTAPGARALLEEGPGGGPPVTVAEGASHTVGERAGAGFYAPGLLDHWFRGFVTDKWLAFAFHMALILVTGHALAVAPPVRRLLRRLAGLPRTGRQAVLLTSAVSLLTGLLNWGFSLVASAYFAREVALEGKRRGLAFHYPLLAACGYFGLMIWHGGLSGSAPLQVAAPGHPFEGKMGVVPITGTLLHPVNLFVSGLLLVAVPAIAVFLVPTSKGSIQEIAADPGDDAPIGGSVAPAGTAARWLDESVIVTGGVLLLGALVLAWTFLGWAQPTRAAGLSGITLPTVIAVFLLAGMALHRTPIAYVRAVEDGIGGAAGIVLQFPFYIGILHMVQDSGLGATIAGWFVTLSNSTGAAATTFPVFTWLAASFLNMFVTSGGGLWGVAGGTALDAAQALGVPAEKALLAVAYGDEWTNMIQPFWAVPLLAITGVRAGDIMGYTAVVMLATGPIYAIGLALL
ncbi:MAG: TIGR00366 family protein [Planctomycetales bacterium]|nr:TIGR00366 family protein [Planctomycetales bacterium]